jgi:hypothetical protein
LANQGRNSMPGLLANQLWIIFAPWIGDLSCCINLTQISENLIWIDGSSVSPSISKYFFAFNFP